MGHVAIGRALGSTQIQAYCIEFGKNWSKGRGNMCERGRNSKEECVALEADARTFNINSSRADTLFKCVNEGEKGIRGDLRLLARDGAAGILCCAIHLSRSRR